MAPQACPCQQANCTCGLRRADERKASTRLSVVSCGYVVERVTGIEPALSAWEVCGVARLLPAVSVTCGDLDGLSASDRDYPWALFLSGTQRARVHPRIKRRAQPRMKQSESVRSLGSTGRTSPNWAAVVPVCMAALLLPSRWVASPG